MRNPFYLLLFLIVSSGCHAVSQNILDSFNKVNTSLERSNKEILRKNAFEMYYIDIGQKGDPNQEWVRRADTLYQATGETVDLIDRIIAILRDKDSVGENTGIGAALLVHTPIGDSLSVMIRGLSQYSYAALVTPGKKASLDSALSDVKEQTGRPNWMEENFTNTPSIAVITMLTYYKMSAIKGATITMSDIDWHCNLR